jgi:hypothetical protein
MLALAGPAASSLKVFERRAAAGRDTVSVGHQAARDALAVRNELAADCHGVTYARIVIVLGARGNGRKLRHKAEQGENGCVTEFHGPFPISGRC